MAEEGETKKEGGRHGDKPQQEANDTQQVHTLEFVCVCACAAEGETARASQRTRGERKEGRESDAEAGRAAPLLPSTLSLSLWSRRVAASDSA